MNSNYSEEELKKKLTKEQFKVLVKKVLKHHLLANFYIIKRVETILAQFAEQSYFIVTPNMTQIRQD